MPSAWRIVRAARVKSAFTGEGARVYGGRWNSRGDRSGLCKRTRIAGGAGIARPSYAAVSERSISLVSTPLGRQTDRAFSSQKSPTALECRTADVPNHANRRRVGAARKVRRPGSTQRVKHERDELFVKSEASRFQKDQN